MTIKKVWFTKDHWDHQEIVWLKSEIHQDVNVIKLFKPEMHQFLFYVRLLLWNIADQFH